MIKLSLREVTGQAPLSSQEARSSGLAPDFSPVTPPQSFWGAIVIALSQAAYWVTVGRAGPRLDADSDGTSEHPLGDWGQRESQGSGPCQAHLLRLISPHAPSRGKYTPLIPDQETK